MIALGIDPGSAICGFAFVQALNAQISPLHFGVITTSPKAPFPDRLLKIHSELDSLINSFHPDVLGIEKLFFGRNSTTALPVAHARGVVLLAAAAHKTAYQNCDQPIDARKYFKTTEYTQFTECFFGKLAIFIPYIL